eukprot:1670275-Rhodomonas_salina.1
MESSRTWFEKSAAKGVPEGMYQLGLCYERGKGVRPDAKRAVAYYRQAAELGLVNAQVALAICLERGEGVEQQYRSLGTDTAGWDYQNEKEAVEWYRRAGEQSSEAQVISAIPLRSQYAIPGTDNRAVCTSQSSRCLVLTPDLAAFRELWQQASSEPPSTNTGAFTCQAAALFGAAAATHATAQLQLGVAYQYGIGVRQDPAVCAGVGAALLVCMACRPVWLTMLACAVAIQRPSIASYELHHRVALSARARSAMPGTDTACCVSRSAGRHPEVPYVAAKSQRGWEP